MNKEPNGFFINYLIVFFPNCFAGIRINDQGSNPT